MKIIRKLFDTMLSGSEVYQDTMKRVDELAKAFLKSAEATHSQTQALMRHEALIRMLVNEVRSNGINMEFPERSETKPGSDKPN